MTEQEVKEALATFSLNGNTIPEYMHEGIINYLAYGIKPGDFLKAVIQNDLFRAVTKADDTNKDLLKTYVAFFTNKAPLNSWGSREIMQEYIEEAKRNERYKDN